MRRPLLRAAFIERRRLDLLVRRTRSGKCPAHLRDPMIRDALFCRYSTVQTVINETGGSAQQVLEAAGELSQQSEALDEKMTSFLADIRAA